MLEYNAIDMELRADPSSNICGVLVNKLSILCLRGPAQYLFYGQGV